MADAEPASRDRATAVTGIVRQPRRPAGWHAPGPASSGWGDPRNAPVDGEDLCWLAGDWRILQRIDGHRWSLDDLVTAWLAASTVAARPPLLSADLGCGIGSVLLLIAWRFPATRAIGVEAQEVSFALARRSIAGNGIGARCTVRHGDLRDAASLPEGAAFDLVTGTPPYLPAGTGLASPRVQCAPCRIEQRGGIEDYCAAAARLLAAGGAFVTCAGALQGPRVHAAASAAGLRVRRAVEVVPRAGKAALFAVHALARAEDPCGPDERAADASLTVRDERGAWTPAFRALRRDMGLPDQPPGAC
jgi:tRNA1(Val) A37 N6-methylase TrmN6